MPGYLSDLRRGAARSALQKHDKPLDPMREPPEVKPTGRSILETMPEGWTDLSPEELRMSPEFLALGPAEQDLVLESVVTNPVSPGDGPIGPAEEFHGQHADGTGTAEPSPSYSEAQAHPLQNLPPEDPRIGLGRDVMRESMRSAPAPQEAPPARQSSTDRTRRK